MGRLPKKKDQKQVEAPIVEKRVSQRIKKTPPPLPDPIKKKKDEKKKVTEKVKKAKSQKIEKPKELHLKKSRTKPKLEKDHEEVKGGKKQKIEPLTAALSVVPEKRSSRRGKTENILQTKGEAAQEKPKPEAKKKEPKKVVKVVRQAKEKDDSQNGHGDPLDFLNKREPLVEPIPSQPSINNCGEALSLELPKLDVLKSVIVEEKPQEPRPSPVHRPQKSTIEFEEDDDMEFLLTKNASGKKQDSTKNDESNLVVQKSLKYKNEDFVREAQLKVEDVYYFTKPPLGTGLFGTVYKCKHKKTGVIRAIKRIKKDHKNAKNIETLLKDVDILKTLDHPNIIKVYEYFQDESAVYIVTDLCSGGELFEHIIKEKNFNERKAAELMRQILSAISYCHEKNLVHCDLKPENIMFESQAQNSTVKIIDFGNSSFCKGDDKLSNRFGSVYYVAPEVLMSSYNEKCDVWSLGVILFLILSGKPPFNGNSDQVILKKVYEGKYSMEGPEWQEISSDAKDLISKMLTLDFKTRVTAKKCLEHKWIKEIGKVDAKTTNAPLNRRSLRNLKTFRAEFQLQGAIVSYVVYQLASKEEREDLTNTFMLLDEDNDGKLTREDLIKAYEKMGEDPESVRTFVDSIIKNIDKSEKGYIDYTEYMTASLSKRRLFTEDRLNQAFKLFDETDQGFISVENFKTILNKGEFAQIDESLWSALIQEATQGEDKINFENFQKMMSLFTQNEQITQSMAL